MHLCPSCLGAKRVPGLLGIWQKCRTCNGRGEVNLTLRGKRK